jgi:hypothetical protein
MVRAVAAAIFNCLILILYTLCSVVISVLFFRQKTKGMEILKGGLLFAELLFLTAAFGAFIFMLSTIIKQQVLSVAAVIILILIINPGLKIVLDTIGLKFIADNFLILNMIDEITDFSFDMARIFWHIFLAVIYFLVSIAIGSKIYSKQKI